MLIGFSAFKFACGCCVTALPKLVRQDESPTDEEEAEDTVGFDFELEDLIRFSQMFERAFVPIFPLSPIRAKSAANFC